MGKYKAGFVAKLVTCLLGCLVSCSLFAANATPKAAPTTAPTAAPTAGAVEDWKGTSPTNEFTLGAHTGLAIINDQAGFAVLASAAKKIMNRGFVPDINDQLFVELQIGPVFVQSTTALFCGMHLRWDFYKDDDWSFFALGGLGITQTSSGFPTGGSQSQVYPRFGVGAVWSFADIVAVRLELSHEFIGAGLQFSL